MDLLRQFAAVAATAALFGAASGAGGAYLMRDNLRGPVGPAGPIGPVGATGAEGPAGADGTIDPTLTLQYDLELRVLQSRLKEAEAALVQLEQASLTPAPACFEQRVLVQRGPFLRDLSDVSTTYACLSPR